MLLQGDTRQKWEEPTRLESQLAWFAQWQTRVTTLTSRRGRPIPEVFLQRDTHTHTLAYSHTYKYIMQTHTQSEQARERGDTKRKHGIKTKLNSVPYALLSVKPPSHQKDCTCFQS